MKATIAVLAILIGAGCGVEAQGFPSATATAGAATDASLTTGRTPGVGGTSSAISTGDMTTATAGATTTADDVVKFDVGAGVDVGDALPEEECLDGTAYMAIGEGCAADTVIYDRQEAALSLTVTQGQLYEITDPAVEVVLATTQPGYEGFFTIAREVAAPNVFYFIIGDDDFVQQESGCGIGPECEPSCNAGPGGDMCRAFLEDFVPIVAAEFIGTPYTVDSFGRRRHGTCCAPSSEGSCNASASTYTHLQASGPQGTLHVIFQDGVAFLEHMGWDHSELDDVNGAAQFEFDLCNLPTPQG